MSDYGSWESWQHPEENSWPPGGVGVPEEGSFSQQNAPTTVAPEWHLTRAQCISFVLESSEPLLNTDSPRFIAEHTDFLILGLWFYARPDDTVVCLGSEKLEP